jgi:hypothetical protein
MAACAALVALASGCGRGASHEIVVQSPDRLLWAAELKHPGVVSDPQLVNKIREAAKASGARVLDVTVLSLSGDRHAPVLTLQSNDPASYMKHHFLGFLQQTGFTTPTPRRAWFVELVDGDGKFAWSAGHVGNTGMLHIRPDLDSCSPVVHSRPFGAKYPPCPAD